MGQRQSGEGSLVPPSGDDCRAASLAWRHCFWWRPPQKVAVQSIAVAAHLLDAAYRSAAVQRSRGEQRRPATREMPLKKPGGALVGRLSSETSRVLLASIFTICILILRLLLRTTSSISSSFTVPCFVPLRSSLALSLMSPLGPAALPYGACRIEEF